MIVKYSKLAVTVAIKKPQKQERMWKKYTQRETHRVRLHSGVVFHAFLHDNYAEGERD